MVTHKKIETFWVVIWLLSGNVIHPVVKNIVLDVAVIFDDDTPLELLLLFYSTTYDDLSYKRDMEEIFF